jgi:hypothetical protein
MGREHDIVEREQRVVGIDGLLLEDVERGAGDPTLTERVGERSPVHDRTTRDVDEKSRRLHQCEAPRVDQVVRVGSERAREDDEVRVREQLVERAQLDAVGGLEIRVGGGDPQAERSREACKLASDVAQADDAERPALQAGADVGEPVPTARAHQPVHLEQPVRQREHECHRSGRHRPAHAVGRHGHQHPRRRAGLDIDVVHSDAEARDQPEPTGCRHRRRRDVRVEEHDRVVQRHLVGGEVSFAANPLPFEALRPVEEREVVGGPTVLAAEIGGDADSHSRSAAMPAPTASS